MSGTYDRTLSGVTWRVEGIPVTGPDADAPCSLNDLARAECAIALAALESGHYTGEVARYARKVCGFTVEALAEHCGVAAWRIRDNEALTGELSRAWPLADVLALLRASDRGGFIARRVTP